MRLPIYHVDAFTDRPFGGNPAAVVPLKEWLPDALMQAIAAKNNMPESAFFVPEGDRYALRWFTPAIEVDLCGHATLGTAYIITRFLAPERRTFSFSTLRAGRLTVTREGVEMVMDFPARHRNRRDPGGPRGGARRGPGTLLEGHTRRYRRVPEPDRGRHAPARFWHAETPVPVSADSDGTRRRRHRFRLALLCSPLWHRRGSSD